MQYVGHVIRPPNESDSMVLQVTFGCSHASCRFCGAYPQDFGFKSLESIFADLAWFRRTHGSNMRKLFLADGNALVRSDTELIAIMNEAHRLFPRLRRVSSYANARDILQRSSSSLGKLRDHGLTLLYLGLESGDDEVLAFMAKDHTVAEMIEAANSAQNSGIGASVMALLGLAGDDPTRSNNHAKATAQALNSMNPRFINLLSLMVVPGTPLAQDVGNGLFCPANDETVLDELRTLILHLQVKGSVFRANHASNPLPLAGRLPRDKDRLLSIVEQARAGHQTLIPSMLRGL